MTDTERQAVREAMGRLLKGRPIRCDRTLTIKILTDETDVKRWILTTDSGTCKTSCGTVWPDLAATRNPARLFKARVQDLLQEGQRLQTNMLTERAQRESAQAPATPHPCLPPGPPT